ncbi:hypothetical protein [Streptodolium elevatio]
MTGGAYDAAEFVVGLAVPDCTKTVSSRDDGGGTTVWSTASPDAARSLGEREVRVVSLAAEVRVRQPT